VVLVVGSASRDLTPDDRRGWRLGGAVTYASLALARLGLPVRALIGADREASDAIELDALRAAAVDVVVSPLARAPVFVNEERRGGRVQLCIEASDPLEPGRLPAGWESSALLLGPVAGELGPAWSEVPGSAAVVALGWQGLLRRVVAGERVERLPPEPHPFLDRADLVAVSGGDLGTHQRLSGLIDLMKPGATLVVTRGDRGGTAVTSNGPRRSGLRAYPSIPADRVIDPTGAGDVFLATLLATLVDGDRLAASTWAERLGLAAAAASLAVEAHGIAGVPTLAAVRRRVADVA
jgi:sugar/nucleoside kinase (ribokinase family)